MVTEKAILSIIIPVLNEREILPLVEDIHRKWRETSGVEVVFVDGGSEDGTVEWLESNGFRVIRSDRGRACQMNTGAAASCGKVLLFLHVDTILPVRFGCVETIELIQAGLAQRGISWGRFDVEIEGQSWFLGIVAFFMNWRSRLTGIATGDQAIFLKREIFQKLGGFPDQPLMEDIEVSRRLRIQHGRPLCFKHRVITSGRRWEENGVWRTVLLMWRLRLAYWMGTSAEKLVERYYPGKEKADECRKRIIRILIFAKAPIPGEVKTRLIPTLGAEGAAELADRMLKLTLVECLKVREREEEIKLELCVSPHTSHHYWKAFQLPVGVSITSQVEGDLGERMSVAAKRTISAGESVILIGTDCPGITGELLFQAVKTLNQTDAIIGPTEDGGYALLGLNRFDRKVFEGIEWSTSNVFRETMVRLKENGFETKILATLKDIDEPGDLKEIGAAIGRRGDAERV